MKIFTGINILLFSASLAFAGNVFSEEVCDNDPFNFFTNASNGWTLLADNDGDTNPGSGGQSFDAEYLFYKYDETSNNLSIGLQTGFDLNDGKVYYGYKNYYAGDLALSFDGDVSGNSGAGYEYAVDFGLYTKDYYNNKVSEKQGSWGDTGTDTAGLYKVDEWNTDILYHTSSPFAMDEGTLVGALSENTKGSGYTLASSNSSCGGSSYCYSYYRVVTFNLNNIVADASDFTVDAHWTMSCGNDYINGNTVISRNDTSAVPEPSMLALFGLGSLSLAVTGYRRRKMQK